MKPVSMACGLALAVLALVAAFPGVGSTRAQSAVSLACGLEPGPTRAVASVIDGDTVRFDDGIEARLIGALAPRGSDGGADAGLPWPPEANARQALHNLVAGQSVALAFAGARTDRYGRTLAHLFLDGPDGQIWVQGRMVEIGHARAASLPESDACIGVLLERERRAREFNLGLWSHAAYQIRPADRPSELDRYRFTFQLIRGHVERTRQTRGLTILELTNNEQPIAERGKPQRGAFRVVWRTNSAQRFGLERAAGLAGRNILVRGWIGGRFGREIEILAAGQLETEDNPAAAQTK